VSECYCPECAKVILDNVDPLLDPDVFGIITEQRVEQGEGAA
jgi:hypothetical protein